MRARCLPRVDRCVAGRALAILVLTLSSAAPLFAQSSVVELNEAGWKALRNTDNDRAAALFNEALTLRPNDPVLLLGFGASAHALGKQQEAMKRLRRALELDPRLTIAARLLGRIAYAEGDAELAIRTYENALKHTPGDAELTGQLEAWRRDAEVHRSFEDRRFDRFRVMFEGHEEASLAAQATSVFNSAFWRIGEKLGEYPTNTIVTILYTEKQFRDITRAPEWSGGQYRRADPHPGRGRLTEARVVRARVDARVDACDCRRDRAGRHPGLAQRRSGPALRRFRYAGREPDGSRPTAAGSRCRSSKRASRT